MNRPTPLPELSEDYYAVLVAGLARIYLLCNAMQHGNEQTQTCMVLEHAYEGALRRYNSENDIRGVPVPCAGLTSTMVN